MIDTSSKPTAQDLSSACNEKQQPSEERQRVNAAIIADLEKLGVIPPEPTEKAGDSE